MDPNKYPERMDNQPENETDGREAEIKIDKITGRRQLAQSVRAEDRRYV